MGNIWPGRKRGGAKVHLHPVDHIRNGRECGRKMKRILSLDVGECTGCESCVEVCPQVFRRNAQTGLMEVMETEDYSEEEVREAIKLCPADCISFE
jgi:ferredoxin